MGHRVYLIDTNVVSEARKKGKANPGVMAFFKRAADQDEANRLHGPTITEGIRAGNAR